jgi:hypothetical protein
VRTGKVSKTSQVKTAQMGSTVDKSDRNTDEEVDQSTEEDTGVGLAMCKLGSLMVVICSQAHHCNRCYNSLNHDPYRPCVFPDPHYKIM